MIAQKADDVLRKNDTDSIGDDFWAILSPRQRRSGVSLPLPPDANGAKLLE